MAINMKCLQGPSSKITKKRFIDRMVPDKRVPCIQSVEIYLYTPKLTILVGCTHEVFVGE